MSKIDRITLNPKRAPSYALIMRMAGVSLAAGFKAIDLSWRNDSIELTYNDNAALWHGHGAIDTHCGQGIARELNDIRQFVLDHFQVIHIGHARG